MVVTGDWAVYAMYKDAPTEDDTTQNVVSFYAGTDKLIQTVGYYAKDKVKFSQYALGIQAPAVEGKIFTGWGFASNDGDVPVDPDMVVTGNWAVYAMYKDAPTDDSKKDDSKPADTTKKNDTKGNTKKTVAQKIKKAVLATPALPLVALRCSPCLPCSASLASPCSASAPESNSVKVAFA